MPGICAGREYPQEKKYARQMEDNAKNYADALIFHMAVCVKASQTAFIVGQNLKFCPRSSANNASE
jgi:hypothetical protein